jgi:hypothetical protein
LLPSPPPTGALRHQASQIDAEKLDIRAVPDPELRFVEIDITPEELAQNAAQSQEGFKYLLEQNARMQIFHNPAFGFYSEPAESREAFLDRCMEEANHRLEDEQERLESTFRRRIDQLRERSEREQREIEDDESRPHTENKEVNVAWGQALYNITSGRPAAVADATASVREGDYLENIAQIQKVWDRELQAFREDLQQKARSIEEISIVPTQKNIEVTKYLILWAGNLP